MINIIAHTMAYRGGPVNESVKLEQYTDYYYTEYKKIYEECFREMRTALEVKPVDCCASREVLIQKKRDIFLLIKEGILIGSVAIYENEIDDLIVAKQYQQKGYGKLLLKFAVHYLQQREVFPIILHVADWNNGAMQLYFNNGFHIIKTETIKREK